MTTEPDSPIRARRSRLRRLAIDLRPLRTARDFRLVWTGLLITSTGSQFTLVAVFVQVRDLTGSAAAVGATGLAWLVGLVAGSLAGGAILDAHDRRRMLMGAQLILACGSSLLLTSALLGDPPLWLVYGGLVVLAAGSAIDSPTRNAMTPRLVGHELVPAAQALNQVVWNTSALVGPALAGLVVARFGVTFAYAVDLLSIAGMFVAATLLRPMPPLDAERSGAGLPAIREGFAFARRHRLIMSTFAIDLIAMVFGLPRALFPFLIVEQFQRSEAALGLLFAAPAVGALLGALTSGWTGRVERQGIAVIVSVVAWGVAVAAFGASGTWLWLGLAMLAAAGWADVISAIFRSTILQVSAPDRLLGRLNGIHVLVVTGGPRLGDVEAGVVARLVSPTFSVISGGIACVVGAVLVALAYPELRRARAPRRS
ncbi:MAG TPA: MFS transporter [Actinomycetota bacterium]|nr:MFS transporter [Actinomycetota bacterium]